MSRRSLTLVIASIGVIAALAIAVLIPVPYVILGPGPSLNTLGKDASGQPIITIVGHPTYPTTGNLNMVTVGYQGGPGVTINIFSALAAWLNPHEAVVPESELFAPGQTQQQSQQQDTQQMTGSQQDAVAAALRAAGWRPRYGNAEVLQILLEARKGRHAVAGRRIARKEATITAAGATVAVIGTTAAIVRRARRHRRTDL